MDGWIKLHRKLMESETFSRLTAIQKVIAIYIALNANHDDGVWYDKYKDIEVEVKRGQLVVSRNKIAKEWFGGDKDVTDMKIRTCLDKLERLGFLTKSPTSNYTLITVLNYGIYQGSDTDDNQADNQVVTKSQPSDNQEKTTNKNDKNVKNDKKVIKKDIIPKIAFAEFVKLTQEEYDKLAATHGEDRAKRMIEILDNYKGANNKKYASDYRAILNWVVKRVEEEEAKGGRKQSEPFGRGQATTNQYNEHHSKTSKEAVQQQSNAGSVPGTRKPIQENGDPSAPSKYDIFVR
ncbi:hypothetical protein [Paenibacillus sp. 79R4]|uniref:hypothetical protein n=1 Tax=Paenibacillus sp. 79R4 TaxID=2212847 RepID=UPI001C4C7679|nr:hypothetical protein [Paenibacillus sp. 79R4]